MKKSKLIKSILRDIIFNETTYKIILMLCVIALGIAIYNIIDLIQFTF